MRNAFIPLVSAAIAGIAAAVLPNSIADAEGQYAQFFARHDQLHPAIVEERRRQDVYVRGAVWDPEARTIRVDAETTYGKGSLVVVEGLPVTDWVTAFQVAKGKSVSFHLPIPDNELIPCRIIVRSAHAFRITRVVDAPPTCVADAEAENVLLAANW